MLNQLKAAFGRSSIWSFNVMERDKWVAQQAATLPSGSRLLDVGAGSCPYRPYFQHCQYETQDFKGLEPDQLRDRQGYGQVDYVCDATAIPVPDASFDAILCTEVLEHVPEPLRVLQEFGRILKPGGTLLISAPLGSGLHQEPFHFYGGYTPYWYQRFLGELGFDDIRIEANGGFYKHFGQESWRFAMLSNPLGLQEGPATKLLWAPVWLLLAPFFALVVPVLCHYIDRFDPHRGFTVGYHVRAVKAAQ